MQSWNMHNILVVWRDGRDVLVSQYFHSLFKNDRGNERLVALSRADLGFADYEDVKGNLPAFIEYVFERKRHPRMSWADFVNRWAACDRCVHVKYEDLRINAVNELRRVVKELSHRELNAELATTIVNKHSFENVSGRRAGQENKKSFLRKGIVGDWKNYFDEYARQKIYSYAGKELIRLGYEVDDTWVQHPG